MRRTETTTQLSRYDRTILERLREARASGPTWASYVRRFRSQWFFVALFFGALSWFLPEGMPLFLGLALGIWLSDLNWIQNARYQWTFMREVIDWQRLDQILDAGAAPVTTVRESEP